MKTYSCKSLMKMKYLCLLIDLKLLWIESYCHNTTQQLHCNIVNLDLKLHQVLLEKLSLLWLSRWMKGSDVTAEEYIPRLAERKCKQYFMEQMKLWMEKQLRNSYYSYTHYHSPFPVTLISENFPSMSTFLASQIYDGFLSSRITTCSASTLSPSSDDPPYWYKHQVSQKATAKTTTS